MLPRGPSFDSYRRFLSSLSRRSRALLFAVIFCLFATFGFLGDIMSGGRHSALRIGFDVAFSGLMAAVFAFVTARHSRLRWPLLISQLIAGFVVAAIAPTVLGDGPVLTGDALILRLTIDGMGTMMAVVCGYVVLAMFLAIESAAFLRIRAEMALAQEIHRTLVPAVAGRTDRFEFAGASHPSGEVGGDLVDVFTEPGGNRSIAYVADVSGHGVDAGVVMGLVKSAARMALIRRAPLEELLRDLNEVLVPLTSSSMYVTAAVVEASPLGFRFALAGHWPILHVRDNGRTIDEGTVQNLPLGFFAGQSYATASLTCRSGDLLALITDGFVEVFDRDDREFGLEAVKQVLIETADRSLPDVLSALRLAVQAHGAQIDDQSALLLRVIR